MSTDDYLYTRPPTKRFKRGESAMLERFLEKMEQATTIHPIGSMKELQLSPDGSTKRGGYRYTSYGFRQVAQLLCPGLSKMLPDLSGTILQANPAGVEYFPLEAQQMFNQMLDLRGSVLESYRVVRNADSKLIEGLLGAKHKSLENVESYRLAQNAVQSNCTDMEFYAASLIGRRLMLWYRGTNPVCTLKAADSKWRIFPGYYFSNGETTGNSVRGTIAIYTRQGVSLKPFRKADKVAHVGRGFDNRLKKMFNAVLTSPIPAAEIERGLTDMLHTPLGYASKESKARTAHSKQIVQFLAGLGVPQRLASSALDDAVFLGCAGTDRIPTYEIPAAYRTRTVFDLYAALMRIARSLPVDRREKMEQAAYSLISETRRNNALWQRTK